MGDVIKSYLVSLGFGVDETSLGKFNQSIEKASTRVLALYGAVKIAAAGIFYSIANISKGFEDLGYEYKMIAPAINKALILRMEMLRAYKAAGVSLTQAIQQSVKFNMALTKLQYTFRALFSGVAVRFMPMLTKQMDIFRKQIYANMPRIQMALEKFIKFIFKAFEATVILGKRVWSILSRVYDFFAKLHKATDGWSTIILGVVAAWRLLNLSFIATPLGAVITGLITLLALLDDLETYKEGGKSLFDWGPVIPILDKIGEYLKSFVAFISSLISAVVSLFNAFKKLLALDFMGFFDGLIDANKKLADFLFKVYELVKNLLQVHQMIRGAFGDAIMWAAEKSGLLGPQQQPLGNFNQPGVNQQVTQQTSITVQGSPDANSTGKVVADQQSRVNFDMTRNLRANAR